MHARDQSSIFSTGGKFCHDYGLLLELHALTLVGHSYALLGVVPVSLPKAGEFVQQTPVGSLWLGEELWT